MNFGNHEPHETVHGREKYKWVLLVFLFVAFFLELGSRQLYNAVLPQIRLEVSLLGFLLCIGPMLWVARAGSFPECCAAMAVLGMTIGVYDAAHYPAMFDCIEPRYRSAATGITGCMAFLMGSLAPATLGWMNDHMSMRSSFASLGWFYLAGALVLLPALAWLFKRDDIADGEPQGGRR